MPASASRLKIDRVVVGPITHVRLKGVIDESFNPTELAQGMAADVVLDLSGIERISSFGVREWMRFMKELPPGVTGIYVVNAPVVIVDQLSMVEGFAGVSRFLSLLAPYSCEKCAEDRVRLVDLRADAALIEKGEAPPHNCPVCANPLTFADVPEEFFAWPKMNPVGEIAPVVDHYLRTISAPQQSQLSSHVKVVEGNITYIRLVGTIGKDLNPRRLGGGLDGTVAFDVGHVTKIDEAGVQKLIQTLSTGAASANVYLWRAPVLVLEALVAAQPPLVIKVASLQLNAECLNCGQPIPDRIPVGRYFERAESGKLISPDKCAVCNGQLRLPMLTAQLMDFLRPSSTEPVPDAEIEALEPRALSQYLSLTAGPPKAARKNTGETENSASARDLQVLRRIGRGGMAEVFLARQGGLKGFEKYVCLKKILPQFASRPDFVEMLFAEARSSARLTHPNIVQIYDVGMLDGSAYITMEYVRGADLRRLMVDLRKKNGRLPVEHAVRIIAETAAGLDFAHSYIDPTGKPHPVVHRDVSPHNILVSFDGAIKLSDFGIAKAQGESEHTEPGMLKGKIAYIPPETVQGKPPDGRGDVFSLGVTLYDILTLRMPFRRESDFATLHAIVKEDPPDPRQFNSGISPRLSQVVLKSMAKNPDERYQTAGEFREELEAALAQMGLHSTPMSVAQFFTSQLDELVAEVGGGKTAGVTHRESSASGVISTQPAAASAPVPIGAEDSSLIIDSGEPDSAPTAAQPAKLTEADDTAFTPPPVAARVNAATSPGAVATPAPGRSSGSAAAIKAPSAPSQGVTRTLHTPAPPGIQRPASGVTPPPTKEAPAVVAARPAPAAPPPSIARPAPAAPPPPKPAPPVPDFDVPEPKTDIGEPIQARAHNPQPAQPPAAPPAAELAKPKKSGFKRMLPASIAAAVLIAAGGGFVAMKGFGEKQIQLSKLEPDERVYVDGVRVDGNSFKAQGGRTPLVAVARQGQLTRQGIAADSDLDVTTLPEIRISPGEQAQLSVLSDPKGCSVIIAGAHNASTTPLATSIAAGREVLVEVMCPGLPRWTRWVMAGPGQPVQLSARMFDGDATP